MHACTLRRQVEMVERIGFKLGNEDFVDPRGIPEKAELA
jgi:hypothetical protein